LIRPAPSPFSFEAPVFDPSSDPHMVLKWVKTAGEITKGQNSKVFKLCEYGSLVYAGNNVFLCLPLDTHEETFFNGVLYKKKPYPKDYNRDPSPYVLRKVGDDFVCSCQWNTKMGKVCAHIVALKVEFKRNKWGSKHA